MFAQLSLFPEDVTPITYLEPHETLDLMKTESEWLHLGFKVCHYQKHYPIGRRRISYTRSEPLYDFMQVDILHKVDPATARRRNSWYDRVEPYHNSV